MASVAERDAYARECHMFQVQKIEAEKREALQKVFSMSTEEYLKRVGIPSFTGLGW